MYPEVIGYGDWGAEDFEDYYKRWPDELKTIPKSIVEHWIHRHWQDFQDWIVLKPHTWKFELCEFDNAEALKVDHFGDWPETFNGWGRELVELEPRSETWLGQYMLENGTFPEPIIVAKNCGHVVHPKGFKDDYMKEPYHLIEGHFRISYLWGMIQANYHSLKGKHQVWLISIPPS